MDMMPETRVLLGVDVIGSAANEGHQYNALWRALDRMLGTALHECGIPTEELLDREPGGDGVLYTLPSRRLGTALDLTEHLDRLAAAHNRRNKPDLRLRIAVELGAVGDQPGYYAPKIRHQRLLNARAFKELMEHCLRERPEGSVNTGLIVSAPTFREVFGGDYTNAVQHHDFAEIEASEKEVTETAWVRVPGLDSRTLTEFVAATTHPAADVAETTPESTAGVVNQVFGTMNGVQAGDVHGDINFGPGKT
jgi:hypothetical protein